MVSQGEALLRTYVLIPGAGGAAWYWNRVVPLLQEAGHEAIAVDLPGDDERAGLPEYVRLAVDAIGDRDDVVIVAQSLGGFTAPLVAAKVPVGGLVLVNAMIPVPGETPGAWSDNTGSVQARSAAAERGGYGTEFDEVAYFLHDVPPQIAAAGAQHQRPEAAAVFGSDCDFGAWPPVPGETPGAWWDNTGSVQARGAGADGGGGGPDFEESASFLHAAPPQIAAAGAIC